VSIHVQSAVWKMTGLSPVEKLVMLKLADHADDEGRNAYPSVPTMAREAGCCERTVQRTLRELAGKGLICVTDRATRYKPTCYAVVLSGVTAAQAGVTSTTFRGDTAKSPEPSIEPSMIPSESPKRAKSLSNPKRPFTAEDKAAFLEEFRGLPDVEGSIRKAMNSPGYQFGTDKYGHVRDWLLRDAERERRSHGTAGRNVRPGAQPQLPRSQAPGTHPGRAPDLVV